MSALTKYATIALTLKWKIDSSWELTMCPDDLDHNKSCHDDNHMNHLCFLFSHGIDEDNPEEFIEELMDEPRFQCHTCGRKSNSEENVCMPIEL